MSILKRSSLLAAERLQTATREFQGNNADPDARSFADALISSGDLTDWQVEKLLKGRHKGFFLGKYKLLKMIGKGGMSSVYLAEHVMMKRRCAIKVLPWKLVTNSSFLQRFYREAQLVAQLDHPHIVRAYDVDHEKEGEIDIHFLVMEYVDGRNFFEIVSDQGPQDCRRAVDLIEQGCEGLAYAHRAGLVHRDIKPGNFILDEHGRVRLMDLGLARVTDASEEASLTVAHDEKVLGTADYLAPEQAVDSHTVDPRADLYSLGCTLYFLLTGHPPFNQGTLTQRLLAHQTKEPPPVEEERPDVPQSLVLIIRKLMAKKPEDRYQSADEVVTVLKEWLASLDSTDAELAIPNAMIPPSTERPAPPPGSTRVQSPSSKKTSSSGKSVAKKSARESGKLAFDDAPSSTTSSGKDSSSEILEAEPLSAITIDLPADFSLHDSETLDLSLDSQPTRVEGKSGTSRSGARKASKSAVQAKRSNVSLPKLPSFSQYSELPRWVSYAAGGVAVLVAVVVAWVLFAPNGQPAPAPGPGNAVTGPPKVERPEVTGTTVTVGPEGNFGTISEALTYVRGSWDSGSTAINEVRIAPGFTPPDALDLDNSFGVSRALRIVGDAANPPVLNPAGDGPAIRLKGCEKLLLENLKVNSKGRSVAVELNGYLTESRLNHVTIEDVSGIAVLCRGVKGLGSSPAKIENCTIRFSSDKAAGVEFQSGSLQDTSSVQVVGCRFIGPGAQAIVLQEAFTDVLLRSNIFYKTGTAVLVKGNDNRLGLNVSNNTFFGCQRGVEFTGSLESRVERITFSQNLFLDQSGPEVAFGSGNADLNRLTANTSPIKYNWSQRASGGSGELDIFASEGRRAAPAVTFVSEDPTSADFLKPKLQELKSAVKQPVGPHNYIGAVSP
ncbi:MAG: protein kinase [Planctomycetaceae bacterium]|nr:protein kinase [Planctomycetaceae bacterium]